MRRLVVVGGGFAGARSALAAALLARRTSGELDVTVVAPNEDLVIRPRLYQADPDRMRVPLRDLLALQGVRHHRAAVERIDLAARAVRGDDGSVLTWDRLVVATGSRIRRPTIPGAELVHDVDSIEAAQALQHHLDGLPARPRTGGRLTAVVVGSGFTGLEVASELVARLRALTCVDAHERPRVLLVDHHPRVAPTLGPGPHADIGRQLAAAGVELLLGESVAGFDGSVVTLASGTTVSARTVVWTVGMTAASLAAQLPGSRDALGRLVVDDHLRLPDDPAVYLAGDVAAARADERQLVPQSCQYAMPLGRTAGWNAGADLLDLPSERVRFAPASYVTCQDLGTGEAVFTTGWDRRVQLVGQEAKGMKAAIMEAILPATDEPDALLEQAEPTWPREGLVLA